MTAAEFARERHAGQLRKGTDGPYIVHPQRVARTLAHYYPDRPELEAAGWLHDTLEDTATTPAELEASFGLGVRLLVEAVTKHGEPWRPPADLDALRLKAADALDNVSETLEGLRRGEPVFARFREGQGKVHYWRAIADAVSRELADEPLARELALAVAEAETFVVRDERPDGDRL